MGSSFGRLCWYSFLSAETFSGAAAETGRAEFAGED